MLVDPSKMATSLPCLATCVPYGTLFAQTKCLCHTILCTSLHFVYLTAVCFTFIRVSPTTVIVQSNVPYTIRKEDRMLRISERKHAALCWPFLLLPLRNVLLPFPFKTFFRLYLVFK